MKRFLIFLASLVLLVSLFPYCTSRAQVAEEDIEMDIVGWDAGQGVLSWTFDRDEPKEIEILESEYKGDKAEIVIYIKTQSSPQAIFTQKRQGKLRLQYVWKENKWDLQRIDNLTFK
ncbi:MAG: hypothetical protein GF421_03525 [Candidatus Aminicenantes bacterium]|nr:hypothetical protein [Candidatus Aminicenantes bacterium]